MALTAVLLAAALAAPADPGAATAHARAAAGAGAAAPTTVPAAPALDHGERLPSRARAPFAPPLRRLLRKRSQVSQDLPTGGAASSDPSLVLLSTDLGRRATALLRRARLRGDRTPTRLRLALAGFAGHSLHKPPPTRPG